MIRPRRLPLPSDVGNHYDEIDFFYRELWGEHLHHGLWLDGREEPIKATEQLLALAAGEAGLSRGNQVCDIGCGYGGTARFLAERFECRVTGYTVSRLQYEYAKAATRSGLPCTFKLKDWLAAEEEQESFDATFAIESTEHMEDKAAIFAAAFRVLKPGGRLVVCAWTAAETARRWEVRRLLRPICEEGQLTGLATETEYRNWITRAGFEEVRVTDLSHQVSRTWSVISLRVIRELFRPRAWRYLSHAPNRNRRFLLSIFRIRLAYGTGAFRYLLLTARRPKENRLEITVKP